MTFEIVGEIRAIEAIASGTGIRDLAQLQKLFGRKQLAEAQGFRNRSAGRWYAF